MIKQYVQIYTGAYHNLDILPQFTEPLPRDINEDLGFGTMSPENTVIKYSSAKDIPEEFRDYPVDLDDTLDTPVVGARKKTHSEPKYNIKLGHAIRTNWKGMQKYKDHR